MKHKHVIVTDEHGYERWLNDPEVTILKEFVSYNPTTDEVIVVIVYTRSKIAG